MTDTDPIPHVVPQPIPQFNASDEDIAVNVKKANIAHGELDLDGILTQDRINFLPLFKKIKFNYDAGDPILPRGAFVDLKKAATALMGGNPWLASSYMARITQNIMEIWKVQKEISLAEAANTVASMDLVMVLAKELGDIIMDKAEKEAEMYTALGIAACVALTISIVGLAASMTGSTLASRAKSKRDGIEADTPEAATEQQKNASVAANAPIKSGKSVNADLDAPVAPEPVATQSTGPGAAQKNKGIRESASSELHQSSHSTDSKRSSTSSDTVSDTSVDNSAVLAKSKPSATTGRDESRVRTSQEADAETPTIDQSKKTVGKPQDKAATLEDANRLDAHASRLSLSGKYLMEYTSVMERAVENFIQAGYKPQIAQYERKMETIRAAQQIVKQAMESSSKGNTDAQQVLQAAADLLQKIQDENNRAYSMGRG